MNEDDFKSARFNCDCHADCLVVYRDNDLGQVELAFWTYGQRRGVGLRNRLRWAWKVLRDGSPYPDMVILNKSEATRLGSSLIIQATGAKTVHWNGSVTDKPGVAYRLGDGTSTG